MAKIVPVVNQKGGVGKTTTTVNLGSGLALEGKRVLIIDFDPQGNTTSYFGIDKKELQYTIYDLLKKEAFRDGKMTVEDVLINVGENIDLLPANIKMSQADLSLAGVMGRETLFQRVLKNEIDLSKYDVVLIDCQPTLGLLPVNVLAAADKLIIPVQPEAGSIEGLAELLDTIDLVKEGFNDKLEIAGLLITMVDLRQKAFEDTQEYLTDHFGEKLYNTFIRRNVSVSDSWGYKSVFEVNKDSKGSEDYLNLAKEFIRKEL